MGFLSTPWDCHDPSHYKVKTDSGVIIATMSSEQSPISTQYRDATNLNARIALHTRFSTNPYGWFEWVFDQLDLPSTSHILEVGCGPGRLWLTNVHRLPESWKITLTDFSLGMVTQAKIALQAASNLAFLRYTQTDASAMPFQSGIYDVVIANHMLYHVPDQRRALEEFRRILKPGGRFFASTIGGGHMQELHELVAKFDPQLKTIDMGVVTFNLENGAELLERFFSQVELRYYEDSLEVTDPFLLADYVLSTASEPFSPEVRQKLVQFMDAEIQRQGSFHITKRSGMFLAKEFTL